MAMSKCQECEKEISSLANTCPSCGAPVSNRNARPRTPEQAKLKKVFWTIAYVIIGAAYPLYFLYQYNERSSPQRQTRVAERPLPETERLFVSAVERGRTSYQTGQNDMAKGAARPARAKELCSILLSMEVSEWIGRLSTLSSNSDGKGVLGIDIARNVRIMTWNNALSDATDHTLVEPSSALYSKAVRLKPNSIVLFSGSFIANRTDCAKEGSFTLDGSMTSPDFIFRFSDMAELE